jgi:hypothetical protein
MGVLSAMALRDEELSLSLEAQISLHFQTNCYPQIPQQMVPTAIEALDLVNEGHGDEYIDLPEGVFFRLRDYATGWEIVESYRLGAWVIESELY